MHFALRKNVLVVATVAASVASYGTNAGAQITLVATHDVSIESSIPPSGTDDAFPAIAGTHGDGIWLAWARLPNSVQESAVLGAGHLPGITSGLSYTTFAANTRVTEIAIAHDGAQPLVFFATPDLGPTAGGAGISSWLPAAGSSTAPIVFTGLHATVLEMDAADFGTTANFDIGIATSLPDVEALQARATAGYAAWTTPAYTYASGRAVSAARSFTADVSIYAIATSSSLLVADRAGGSSSTMLANPPIAVSAAPLPAGDFEVAIVSDPSHVALFDTLGSTSVTPSTNLAFAVTSLADVANAPDYTGTGAWTVALSLGPPTLWVHTAADSGATPFLLDASGAYSECARIQAASTPDVPNAVFVTTSCAYHGGARHALLSIFVRTDVVAPDAGPEAGTDAAIDAAPDGSPPDVPDAAMTVDAAIDSSAPADDAPSHGTGPSFRGSGCTCRTGRDDTRSPMAWGGLVLAVAVAMTRRRRTALQRVHVGRESAGRGSTAASVRSARSPCQ